MIALLRTRQTVIWLLLVAATLLSWEAVEGVAWARDRRAGAVLVIAIAFLKARFILLDFMELRTAPFGMRIGAEAWVMAMAGGLIGLFVLTAR